MDGLSVCTRPRRWIIEDESDKLEPSGWMGRKYQYQPPQGDSMRVCCPVRLRVGMWFVRCGLDFDLAVPVTTTQS